MAQLLRGGLLRCQDRPLLPCPGQGAQTEKYALPSLDMNARYSLLGGQSEQRVPGAACSAGPTFDHAGERTVTGRGAVIGQMALPVKQPALV